MDEPEETPLKKIVETPLPPPVTRSEKETFEARIAELEEENEALAKENDELKKPALPSVSKKTVSEIVGEYVPKIFPD